VGDWTAGRRTRCKSSGCDENRTWHALSVKFFTPFCKGLQHTAVRCNALQRTATHCNAQQRTATQWNTLQYSAVHCNTLQHTATHCNTLQHKKITPCFEKFAFSQRHAIELQQAIVLLIQRWSINIVSFNAGKYWIFDEQNDAID